MRNTRKYLGAAALACIGLCVAGLAVAWLLGAGAAVMAGLCALDAVIAGTAAALLFGFWMWRRLRPKEET